VNTGPTTIPGVNSRLKAGEHGPHQNTGVNSREGKVVHAFNKTPDVLLIVNAGRIGAGNREKTQSTSKENWRILSIEEINISYRSTIHVASLMKSHNDMYMKQHSSSTCIWSQYHYSLDRWLLLTMKLLNQGFLVIKLKSLLQKHYGRQHDLIDRYGVTVSQKITYMLCLL
jgi:hypothetical protein